MMLRFHYSRPTYIWQVFEITEMGNPKIFKTCYNYGKCIMQVHSRTGGAHPPCYLNSINGEYYEENWTTQTQRYLQLLPNLGSPTIMIELNHLNPFSEKKLIKPTTDSLFNELSKVTFKPEPTNMRDKTCLTLILELSKYNDELSKLCDFAEYEKFLNFVDQYKNYNGTKLNNSSAKFNKGDWNYLKEFIASPLVINDEKLGYLTDDEKLIKLTNEKFKKPESLPAPTLK